MGTEEIAELQSEVNRLKIEIARLKDGNFTPEEFQNLCHNLHLKGTDSTSNCRESDFRTGCLDYQDKLFGKKKRYQTIVQVAEDTGRKDYKLKILQPQFVIEVDKFLEHGKKYQITIEEVNDNDC